MCSVNMHGRRSVDPEDDKMTVLLPKKHGRPLMLRDLDEKVQLYTLRKLSG